MCVVSDCWIYMDRVLGSLACTLCAPGPQTLLQSEEGEAELVLGAGCCLSIILLGPSVLVTPF